jgi:hypothetical protein
MTGVLDFCFKAIYSQILHLIMMVLADINRTPVECLLYTPDILHVIFWH